MLQMDKSEEIINKDALCYEKAVLSYSSVFTIVSILSKKLISFAYNDYLAICVNDPLNYSLLILALLQTPLHAYLLHPKCPPDEISKLQKNGIPCVTDKDFLKLYDDYSENNCTFSKKELSFCADENCTFIFKTSNTTSDYTKYVEILGKAIIAKAGMLVEILGITKHDITYIVSPMSFIQSIWCLLIHIMSKATVVLDSLSSESFSKMLKLKITTFVTVPSIARVMCQKISDFYSLRLIVLGGDFADKNLIDSLSLLNNNLLYSNVYGCTETSAADLILPPIPVLSTSPTKYSIGTQGKYSTVQLYHHNTKITEPYKIGQLYIKGKFVAKKYFNSDRQLQTNKGFSTGDEAYQDNEGFFYFCGRSSSIIKYNGQKISTLEVESRLLMLDEITDAVVFGLNSPIYGQIPLCILQQNSLIEKAKIKAHLILYLESYKIPQKFYISESIPKTISGKTIRNNKMYQDYILNCTELL